MNKQKNKNKQSFFSEWNDFFGMLNIFWQSFGGSRELLRSPYLHMSIVITLLLNQFWLYEPWYNQATSILPNLLGFGVTGYAIWIGWGDEKLKKLLSEKTNDSTGLSQYIHASAIFAHFSIVQVVALLYAVTCTGLAFEIQENSILSKILLSLHLCKDFFTSLNWLFYGLGYCLFIYSILTALETVLALLRIATWVQKISDSTKSN